MTISLSGAPRWQRFLAAFSDIVGAGLPEARRLDAGGALLADLVAEDDWLDERFTIASTEQYQQYLLHLAPQGAFSVVSFVWGPGQTTPIHDHCVWGLVGMLRGSEISQRYVRSPGGMTPDGTPRTLFPGDIERLSPAEGDIHRVTNASDKVSISIHVYGADIGRVRRHIFAPDGTRSAFVSGYSVATSCG